MKSDGKETEAERHTARIDGRRGFMWKIYAASETCLTLFTDCLLFIVLFAKN